MRMKVALVQRAANWGGTTSSTPLVPWSMGQAVFSCPFVPVFGYSRQAREGLAMFYLRHLHSLIMPVLLLKPVPLRIAGTAKRCGLSDRCLPSGAARCGLEVWRINRGTENETNGAIRI